MLDVDRGEGIRWQKGFRRQFISIIRNPHYIETFQKRPPKVFLSYIEHLCATQRGVSVESGADSNDSDLHKKRREINGAGRGETDRKMTDQI